jgi:hypothetical protein
MTARNKSTPRTTLARWRQPSWRKRVVLLATIVLLVVFASHPELRLLVPILDSLGLDLFLLLIGTQLYHHVLPMLRTIAGAAYAACIYLLGISGPFVEGWVVDRFGGTPRAGLA